MAYADVDGTKLYWEDGGAGAPLLLIQGLGFGAAMWFRVLPALEARCRVIRYDARGIGRSDVPPGPYTIERAAADAAAVLDAAGAPTAHVFGVSLGGIVAQELALTFPQRVRSLTLCSTHPGGPDTVWPDDEVMTMLTSRTSLDPEESIRASSPFAYAPATDPRTIDEDVAMRLRFPNTVEGYTNQLTGGLGYPGTRARLHRLTMPVLLVTGDADRMVPPVNTDTIAGEIPHAEKVVLGGAGHMVFSEQPDRLTSAMLDFVNQTGALDAQR